MISIMSDTRIFRRMFDMEISDFFFYYIGNKANAGFSLEC